MGLEELREHYKEQYDSKEKVKKNLDTNLVEMGVFEHDIQNLTNSYFILYDVAEKEGLLNKSELKQYKIKYFDIMRIMVAIKENEK